MNVRHALIIVMSLFALAAVWKLTSAAQPASNELRNHDPGRYEFEIVESFNAKYLGDTPGHAGRAGDLKVRPHIALGDSVYRGKTLVGSVSGVTWDRARGALTVEFDPEPDLRIAIGDIAWVDISEEKAGRDEVPNKK